MKKYSEIINFKEEFIVSSAANVVILIILYIMIPIMASIIVLPFKLILVDSYHVFGLYFLDFIGIIDFWVILMWMIGIGVIIFDYYNLWKYRRFYNYRMSPK